MKKRWSSLLVLSLGLVGASSVLAADYVITLKDHQFTPQELSVPVGQKIKITVKNQDSTPAEFESTDLNREKVVAGNSEIFIFVGPLDAGRYAFFDDFHRNTTSGTLIAK